MSAANPSLAKPPVANPSLESLPVKGRFAPSPTGRMHGGNIFAALCAWLIAKSQGGTMVLRIENLDTARSKHAFATQIQHDFETLGLTWDEGPYYQQERASAYREAYDQLKRKGLVYPCFCTRADLASLSAPHFGELTVYPGTCRALSSDEVLERERARKPAFRLMVVDETIFIDDLIQGAYWQNLMRQCGDFLIRRSDGGFAYQLAVVVDDGEQGITSVVRGFDLLASTPRQVYLQRLLGIPTPRYAHVPLLVSERNRRLSKRDKDASLDELLLRYKTPAGVIGHIAGLTGLAPSEDPLRPEELLPSFDLFRLSSTLTHREQITWVP